VLIDGNRVIGLKPGNTTLHGQYRAANISLQVQVVEPMDGVVDISLRYAPGQIIRLYAGGERDFLDGPLDEALFVSPESLAVTDDGSLYIADMDQSVLMQYKNEVLTQLAGAAGEKAFIDGSA
jgi:sugar lactone lactonase YvrE